MNTASAPNSTELKRQLEAALAKEKADAEEKIVNEFRAALEGKYFFMRWTWREGQSVAVVRYTGFKPARTDKDACAFNVVYDSATATVSVSNSKKTRHCFEPVGVRRDAHTQCQAAHISDITRHHVKEISKEHYQQFWDTPRLLAEAQIHLWLARVDVPALEVSYEEPFTEAVIDVPHVVIEGPEKSIIHGSPFFLPGSRHLVSPNAKAFVRAKIHEEEATEARCSHLYEACDMNYVTAKRASIAALRAKFGL